MLLSEAIEEIQEKAPNYLSIESIIRKINTVRNQLIRIYGTEIVPMQMDLLEGVPTYPWKLPQGSISHVLVNGSEYPLSQLNALTKSRYYYFLSEMIGIYPEPSETVEKGITILYNRIKAPLTVNALDAEIGFDMDYDMLIVYGVLKDMTSGSASAEYAVKYNDTLNDYLRASTSPEAYQIPEVRW